MSWSLFDQAPFLSGLAQLLARQIQRPEVPDLRGTELASALRNHAAPPAPPQTLGRAPAPPLTSGLPQLGGSVSGSFALGQQGEESRKRAVWEKGHWISGWSPAEWRHDAFGWLIRWSEYGDTTPYGWEIDHVIPPAWGGSDELHNLRPLWWRVNRAKSDKVIPTLPRQR